MTLTFSEDVTLPDGGLRIFDDQGTRADDGRPGKDDARHFKGVARVDKPDPEIGAAGASG